MSEWQKGDLALCVNDSAPKAFGGRRCENWGASGEQGFVPVRRGAIYVVERVGPIKWGGHQGISFSHSPTVPWLVTRFRKVTPPKADEFDREVIEAMTGAPVGEPA